jgi:hypothetical protein
MTTGKLSSRRIFWAPPRLSRTPKTMRFLRLNTICFFSPWDVYPSYFDPFPKKNRPPYRVRQRASFLFLIHFSHSLQIRGFSKKHQKHQNSEKPKENNFRQVKLKVNIFYTFFNIFKMCLKCV